MLLHGLGSSSADWTPQLFVLESRYRVLLVDLPGHGAAPLAPGRLSVDGMAQDLERVLKDAGVGAAHVIGVSLGACVALALALRAPERVLSLVLISAFARLRPAGLRGGLRLLVRLLLLAAAPMPWVAGYVARGLFAGPDRRQLRALARESLARTPREAYVAAIRALLRFDVRRQLGRVRCPTLVVTGAADRTVSERAARRLASGIARARLLVIAHAGHAPHCEKPQLFNRMLLDFLDACS